jgi:uncharacterized membrane protein YhfC
MDPANLYLALLSGIGMIIVGCASIAFCSYRLRPRFRWYWAGAGIWLIAVVLKFLCAFTANPRVFPFLKESVSHPVFVVLGSLYVGIQSSVFEMGVTLAAVLVWRRIAFDAARGLAIGVGAGAFEALLLGLASTISASVAIANVAGTEAVGEQVQLAAATTPLFFLVGPIERIIAILCHVSTRALILLGVVKNRPLLVVYGFAIFTLLDGIAGGAHLTGAIRTVSLWWIELAVLPFAIISVPIIRWCYRNWAGPAPESAQQPY